MTEISAPTIKKKKKPVHYVDNAKFFTEMVKYVNSYNEAIEKHETPPQMNDYIGDAFLKIATNLALKYNFAAYKFREDMISAAIFDCVRYAHKFNEEKTHNPFSYFTQIAFFAFIRTIQKEKKVLYTKYKAINNSELFGLLSESLDVDDMHIINDIGYSEGARENMDEFIREYEKKQEK